MSKHSKTIILKINFFHSFVLISLEMYIFKDFLSTTECNRKTKVFDLLKKVPVSQWTVYANLVYILEFYLSLTVHLTLKPSGMVYYVLKCFTFFKNEFEQNYYMVATNNIALTIFVQRCIWNCPKLIQLYKIMFLNYILNLD